MTVEEFIGNSNLKSSDSRLLLEHVAGIGFSDIIAHPSKELSQKETETLNDLALKRKSGIPIEYIIGKKNFYKDTFNVHPGVLIPQLDTETLVEEAVALALKSEKNSFRILDLCAGSGCIGISVAKEINSHFSEFNVVFADISPIALSCCSENVDALLGSIGHQIICSDLFEKLHDEKFDMILTNPPYIPTKVIETLESDVKHEPHLALDGGETGLDIIRRIITESQLHLNENGYLIMEIGYDQGESVSALFAKQNFREVSVIKDLGARDRVVKGRI